MEIQAPQPTSQNSLPYQPIKFVYTQTIGSVLQKFKEIVDPYTWTYQDILQPQILFNQSKVQYYLFHAAPIYNWLRKVDSQILVNYFNLANKNSNSNLINKPIFSAQKGPSFQKFDTKSFFNEIKHYISQWQIVKLSACAKVKIITTKFDQIQSNSNSNNKQLFSANKNSSKNPQQQQMRCTHMIKKQKFTSEYTLNNFTPTNLKLQCTKVFCEECQQDIKVKAQITKYPFAPYFQKYYGKQFILNDNSSSRLVYQLILIYTTEKIFVKTSGGVWYQVTKQKKFIISFDKIQIKTGLLFIYQQSVISNKMLKKAQPLKSSLTTQKKINNLSKDSEEQQDQQQRLIKKSQMETVQNVLKNKAQKLIKSQNQSKNQQIISQKVDDDQKLQDMTKAPLPIVMKKKSTDKKLFKQYKKTVQSLLPRPKEKDAYEKSYDKGKTKKIHKNRQQFRTADFFKLYKDIKDKNHHNQQSNKDRQIGDHSDEKKKNKENQNSPYRQNDDDYNEVYTDKRSQRRFRGASFSKFGNRGGHNDRGGHHNRGGHSGRGGFNNNRGGSSHRGGSNRGRGGFNNRGGHNNRGNFSKKPYNNNNRNSSNHKSQN